VVDTHKTLAVGGESDAGGPYDAGQSGREGHAAGDMAGSSDASLGAGVAIESAVTARVVGVVVIGVVRVVVAVVGEEGIVVGEVIREVGFLLLEFAGELR